MDPFDCGSMLASFPRLRRSHIVGHNGVLELKNSPRNREIVSRKSDFWCDMSESLQPPGDAGTDRGSVSVEQLCQRFLESWQEGRARPIEKFLSKAPHIDRRRLLRGLLI